MYRVLLISFLLFPFLGFSQKALQIKIAKVDFKDTKLDDVIKSLHEEIHSQKQIYKLMLRMEKGKPMPKVTLKAQNATLSSILSYLVKKHDLDFKYDAKVFQIGNDSKVDWTVTKFYPISSRFTYKYLDAHKKGKTLEEYFKDKGVIIGEESAILQGVSRLVVSATMRNHAKIPKVINER